MVRIITDSAADLTAPETQQPGVFVIPITVLFEDGTLVRDGVDMTGDEYFARLAASQKLPVTSQPSLREFLELFQAAKEAGDEVVAVFISGKLSGTCQGARMAAMECEYDGIHIVDSDTATQGEALLIRRALRLRAQGKNAAQIAEDLEELKKRVRIVAVVDSLKHLHKGGRLPAAVALAGGVLGIKPVLLVKDGEIGLADKARGRPGAYTALFRQLEKLGVDPDCGYALLYSDDRQVMAPIHRYMHETLHLTGGRVAQVGAAIGTHVGPRCAGVAFVAKEP